MMATTSQEIKFFHILGKLFYAVAASDNKVHDSEVKALKKIIKTKWISENNKRVDFQADLYYQIEFIVDWLVENKTDHHTCFNEFISYKKDHEKQFTMIIKQLIWETANVIANAFSGRNKSELIILTKLKLNLQK